jgi:uncharacterized PurR-regulated membrane protein YhhQ (DUF165 family)
MQTPTPRTGTPTSTAASNGKPAKTYLYYLIVLAALLDFSANWLAAHYIIPVGPWLIPSGTFLFALAFTTYDVIRRQGGFSLTVTAVILGFAVSVLYAFVFGSNIGRIAVAGIVALACSSTADLAMQTITLRRPIWQYVGISNAVSLAIDTIVFTTIAFAALPADVQVRIVEGQYLAKIVMTAASIPLVYWVRSLTPSPSRQPA